MSSLPSAMTVTRRRSRRTRSCLNEGFIKGNRWNARRAGGATCAVAHFMQQQTSPLAGAKSTAETPSASCNRVAGRRCNARTHARRTPYCTRAVKLTYWGKQRQRSWSLLVPTIQIPIGPYTKGPYLASFAVHAGARTSGHQ